MTDEIKVKIDFDKIKPENENEKNFFELFIKFKRVIFDWGKDRLYVFEDYENEKTSKKYSIKSDDFLEKVNSTYMLTSADIVLLLACNGINVEIRNSIFKTLEEKNEFMRDIQEKARQIL